MAEGARLESVYTRKCIEGSNPSLTAIFEQKAPTTSEPFAFAAKQSQVLVTVTSLVTFPCAPDSIA